MGLGGLCSSLTSMEILQRVFMEPEKVGKDRNFEVLTEDWKKRQFGGGGAGSVEDSQENLFVQGDSWEGIRLNVTEPGAGQGGGMETVQKAKVI